MVSETHVGQRTLVAQAVRILNVKVAGQIRRVAEPTYADLLKEVRTSLAARRNVKVLREWMAYRDKGPDSPVCKVMLGLSAPQWVKAHCQFMKRFAERDGISRYERRASLKSIRYIALRMADMAIRPIEHARWEALRAHLYINRERIFAGLSRSSIPFTFEEWMAGRYYSFLEKSRTKLAEVERYLGIPEGTFVSHTRRPVPRRLMDLSGKAKPETYSVYLEHKLPPRIMEIAAEYAAYKIDPAPALRRNLLWTANFRGEYPTRAIFERSLTAYWNFAIRPKSRIDNRKHGLGLDPDRVQFIDLFRKEFLISYLRWHIKRAQKVTQGLLTSHYAPFAAMLHRETGWITQQPERFVKELKRSPLRKLDGDRFRGRVQVEEFRCWVAEQLNGVRAFRDSLGLDSAAAATERIRDPFDKIDEILRHPQPLKILHEIVRDHEAHQKEMIFVSEISRVNYETRTFFLACLTAVPLRTLTWSALKVGRNVFKRKTRWVIRVERDLFKNRRHMSNRHYEVTLSEWATPYFDHYMREVRPLTTGAKAGSQFLLPINNERARNQLAPVTTYRLQYGVREATRQHWNAEIGPHAWRHISATGILKDDPEQIVLAATVLNDAPKTIMKTYSHILPDDAFAAFAALSDDVACSRPRPGRRREISTRGLAFKEGFKAR